MHDLVFIIAKTKVHQTQLVFHGYQERGLIRHAKRNQVWETLPVVKYKRYLCSRTTIRNTEL